MEINLMDMDGVLLRPRGYHRALQDTVVHVARLLGYGDLELAPGAIAAFEAAGISNEWDSAALCAALLLDQAWEAAPTLVPPTKLAASDLPAHGLPSPDLAAFAGETARKTDPNQSPVQYARELVLERRNDRPEEQTAALQRILEDSNQINRSLTLQIFQELILGSLLFEETYSLPAEFGVESYLRQYDRSALNPPTYQAFSHWLAEEQNQAVLFTNRPSKTPDGTGGTPEAEIGAQTAGFEDLPLAAMGGLAWLSRQLGQEENHFLKPSPVHALTALQLALGRTLEAALEEALALYQGQPGDSWRRLNGAKMRVFEDTGGGLRSAQAAQQLLARRGISFRFEGIGISPSPVKQAALAALGAVLYPDINRALEDLL